MGLIKHWIASCPWPGSTAVVRVVVDDTADVPEGWTVEGPFAPAADCRGAVEEAADRIFQSGILDDIAESDGGRDAMQDAVAIAHLALGKQ